MTEAGQSGEPTGAVQAPGPVPGLALERTALAFSRNGLAVFACLAVLVRRMIPIDARSDHVVEVALLASAAITWAASLAVGARRANAARLQLDAQSRRFQLITLSTTAIGVAAFLIGLFPPA